MPAPPTSPLGFRIPPDLKLALEKAARDGDRSVSRQVERYLRAGLQADGYLKPATAKTPARRKRPAQLAMPQAELVMGDA